MHKIGESPINAAAWWGSTHIHLNAGHSYRFVASGQWEDDRISCDPNGYPLTDVASTWRPLFKLVEPLRPMNTGDQWFSLLGKVGRTGQPFEIGDGKELKCNNDGILFCTPNDVFWMYWNNHGVLNLEVYDMGLV